MTTEAAQKTREIKEKQEGPDKWQAREEPKKKQLPTIPSTSALASMSQNDNSPAAVDSKSLRCAAKHDDEGPKSGNARNLEMHGTGAGIGSSAAIQDCKGIEEEKVEQSASGKKHFKSLVTQSLRNLNKSKFHRDADGLAQQEKSQKRGEKKESELGSHESMQSRMEEEQQQKDKQQQQQQGETKAQQAGGKQKGCYHQENVEPGGYGEGCPSPSVAAAAIEEETPGMGTPFEGSDLVRNSVHIRIPHRLLSQLPPEMRHLLVSHRDREFSGELPDLVQHPEQAAHVRPRQGVAPEALHEEARRGDEEEGALELRVAEQRLTNLIQSLCVVAFLGAVHVLQLIPTAVVWAYFAYMALESMPGSQFWDRMLMMLTDPRRRTLLLTRAHATYMETVPFNVVAAFTAFELAYLMGVWALVTWAGIGGIAFPVPIIALVPIRSYLLPRVFKPEHLAELDADEYDIVEPLSPDQAVQETGQAPYDIRDIIEDQYSGTQVTHQMSQEALRRRSRTLDLGLARATAPAQFYQGAESV